MYGPGYKVPHGTISRNMLSRFEPGAPADRNERGYVTVARFIRSAQEDPLPLREGDESAAPFHFLTPG